MIDALIIIPDNSLPIGLIEDIEGDAREEVKGMVVELVESYIRQKESIIVTVVPMTSM